MPRARGTASRESLAESNLVPLVHDRLLTLEAVTDQYATEVRNALIPYHVCRPVWIHIVRMDEKQAIWTQRWT